MDRMNIGTSASALARRLQDMFDGRASGYPSADAVSNWLKPVDDRRHAQIPAWALLAVADAAGMPVDLLVGEPERARLLNELDALDARLRNLETKVGREADSDAGSA